MEYMRLEGTIEDLYPEGDYARRRDELYKHSKSKRWASLAAPDDGIDQGWYELDDDGTLKAGDDYYEYR